jgi:hypothetical protein
MLLGCRLRARTSLAQWIVNARSVYVQPRILADRHVQCEYESRSRLVDRVLGARGRENQVKLSVSGGESLAFGVVVEGGA